MHWNRCNCEERSDKFVDRKFWHRVITNAAERQKGEQMSTVAVKKTGDVPADVRKICEASLPMGGFIKETAVSMIADYCPEPVLELLIEAGSTDGRIFEQIKEVSGIYDDVHKEYVDFIHMINIMNRRAIERRPPHIDTDEFTRWYFSRTIDFLYGKKSDQYQCTKKYVDLLELELGDKVVSLLNRLPPVELMMYTSLYRINEFYDREYFIYNSATGYFGVVNKYLIKHVDRNLSEEEIKSVTELGEYEEQFRNYTCKRRIEL